MDTPNAPWLAPSKPLDSHIPVVNWDDYSNSKYMGIKSCSKPPTSMVIIRQIHPYPYFWVTCVARHGTPRSNCPGPRSSQRFPPLCDAFQPWGTWIHENHHFSSGKTKKLMRNWWDIDGKGWTSWNWWQRLNQFKLMGNSWEINGKFMWCFWQRLNQCKLMGNWTKLKDP